MNRILPAVSVVAIVCTIAFSSVSFAKTRENQRLAEGKITKNEAQHLVLKKYPGASVKKCELTAGKEHSIWSCRW